MLCQDCTEKEKPDQVPKNINVAKILLKCYHSEYIRTLNE